MLLALITVTSVVGLGLLLLNLRNAPEGYQDEDGFHFKNKSPQANLEFYNAFAGQQPKRYPVKVSEPRMVA